MTNTITSGERNSRKGTFENFEILPDFYGFEWVEAQRNQFRDLM